MAWSRTRLSILIAAVLLFRFALTDNTIWQLISVILAIAAFGCSQLIVAHRKKALRLGLAEKYGTGHELILLVIQIVLLAAAAIGLVL